MRLQEGPEPDAAWESFYKAPVELAGGTREDLVVALAQGVDPSTTVGAIQVEGVDGQRLMDACLQSVWRGSTGSQEIIAGRPVLRFAGDNAYMYATGTTLYTITAPDDATVAEIIQLLPR